MEQNILVHAFHTNNSDDLRGTDAFLRETTLSILSKLSSEKGYSLNGKNLLPFFPFRRGLECRKANRKLQKLSPL